MTDRPNSTQTIDTTGEQRDADDDARGPYDDRVEQEAARRAGLIERYNQHREELLDNADAKHSQPPWYTAVINALSPTALRQRLNSHKKTVTDIEVDAPVETETPEAAFESVDECANRIRFELDGEAYTPWFEWAPEDPDHALNQIIDYYADGDLNNMFEAEVTINNKDGTLHPVIPTPYASRVAHWRMLVYQLVFLFGTGTDNAYITTGYHDLHRLQSDGTVTVSESQSTHFSEDAATSIMAIPVAGIILSIAVGGLSMIASLPYAGEETVDVPLVIGAGIYGSIGLFVGSLLAAVFLYPLLNHKPRHIFKDAADEALPFLLALLWSPVLLPRYVAGKIDSLFHFNPYRDR